MNTGKVSTSLSYQVFGGYKEQFNTHGFIISYRVMYSGQCGTMRADKVLTPSNVVWC